MNLKGIVSQLFESLRGEWTAPGSPVRLRVPEGFEPTDAFPGLVQPGGAASIMVQVVPAPYEEISAGFGREVLTARGIGLHDDEAVEVDGHTGRLLRLSQPAAGRDFDKWALLLDLEGRTALLMATYPAEDALSLSGLLRETLLQARVRHDDASARGPGLKLGTSPLLQKAAVVAGADLYTPDGGFVPGQPTEASLLACWGMRAVPEAERQGFVTQHIIQADQSLMGVSVTAQREVAIAGLPGYETQAVGRSRDDESGKAVYSVILFTEGGYLVMMGVADEAAASLYVPAFQDMAHGLRL